MMSRGFTPVDPGGTRDSSDAAGHAHPAATGRRDRAWPLVLLGLVLLTGILAAAAWALLRPATVEIPAAQVVVPPAERAVEPYVPVDPTPFLAALPVTSGAWSLTAVNTPDPKQDTALADRVAEVQVLTYSNGERDVVLTARQLYTAEDASRALVRAVGKDVVLEDATVGSTVVGQRAVTETDADTTIRWTHGSAMFEAVGEAEDVRAFVALLGL